MTDKERKKLIAAKRREFNKIVKTCISFCKAVEKSVDKYKAEIKKMQNNTPS